MQHFLSTVDWSAGQLEDLLGLASQLKQEPMQEHLRGKSIALMFLNPSLRTRTSFELGMQQLGGIATVAARIDVIHVCSNRYWYRI